MADGKIKLFYIKSVIFTWYCKNLCTVVWKKLTSIRRWSLTFTKTSNVQCTSKLRSYRVFVSLGTSINFKNNAISVLVDSYAERKSDTSLLGLDKITLCSSPTYEVMKRWMYYGIVYHNDVLTTSTLNTNYERL